MLRAIRPTLLLALAALGFATPAIAQNLGKSIDGIGLIDYSRKTVIKVGTFAQYRVTGHSSKGHSEDYRLVVGVAGEERFWGDNCFWVETVTEGDAENGVSAVASLMSYSIFADSLPVQHLQYFVRKNISDVDERGLPREVVAKGSSGGLKSHTKVDPNTHWYSDTLASDSVTAVGKTYWCKRLHTRRDVANTVERGDSTILTEYREDRDTYLSPLVPLTSIVREDIEYLETRKAWLAGRSQDAEAVVSVHSVGQAMLIGSGHDYRGQMIDESKRRSQRDQDREAGIEPAKAAPKKSAPASTKSTTHKSG